MRADEKVIVTSYLFPDGKFALDRLEGLEKKVGKEKLIVDISCRRREDGWVVAMNGWKTLTDMWVTQGMSPSLPIIAQLPSSIISNSFIGLNPYDRIRIEG
jgi:phosphoribosylformimino-5-aminoimidazole carboxamide ribotide isomerase